VGESSQAGTIPVRFRHGKPRADNGARREGLGRAGCDTTGCRAARGSFWHLSALATPPTQLHQGRDGGIGEDLLLTLPRSEEDGSTDSGDLGRGLVNRCPVGASAPRSADPFDGPWLAFAGSESHGGGRSVNPGGSFIQKSGLATTALGIRPSARARLRSNGPNEREGAMAHRQGRSRSSACLSSRMRDPALRPTAPPRSATGGCRPSA
jgi:hypothetical protein